MRAIITENAGTCLAGRFPSRSLVQYCYSLAFACLDIDAQAAVRSFKRQDLI